MTGLIDPLVPAEPDSAPDIAERDAIRELVLRAHPEVVPELVRGETIAELLASIEPARAAYTGIAERLRQATPATTVPAGGVAPLPVDPARLPAAERIKRGLANRT